MVTIRDVPVNDLIEKTAEELRKESKIKAPEWAVYVKTGVHKERPPARSDWWYVRAAAILKSVEKLGPIGVSKLRTKYGGKKNRGHKPEKFFRGSGNIIRKILQQLEAAQLVKQAEKDVYKGRVITPKGSSLLAKAALDVSKLIVKEAKEEAKKVTVEKHVQQDAKQENKPKQEMKDKPQQKDVKADKAGESKEVKAETKKQIPEEAKNE